MLLGLVFKNGFVGLTLACAAFAAVPAAAKDHGGGPDRGGGPPPHAGGKHGEPPGQQKGAEPGEAESEPQAESPAPAAESAPPADESAPPAAGTPPPDSEAPPAPRRVGIRSLPRPVDAPVEDDPAPAPPERQAPPARPKPQPRSGEEPSEPAAITFHRAVPSRAPADVAAAAPAAAAGASAAPTRGSGGEETRSEPVTPSPAQPARAVAAQVRRIVEVVPTEIWAVLAGLALLTFALAGSSWAATRKARRLRGQREALLQEVGLLQAALLPSVPADVPVSVAYRPCNGGTAGGDFYDAFELSGGRTGVILGDASGRGRDALARTTFIRYTLRAYLEAGLEPREVLKVGSGALADHLEGEFATVIVAVHDPATGRFVYASAGHPPPVVVGAECPYEPVTACSAPPLGIGESSGSRQSTFTLTAGTRACLYTDGVTEARADGRLLGVARLERALAALPPDADAEALLDALTATADELPDDMAVCLISAAEEAPRAGPRIEELEVDGHEAGDSLERFLRACGVAMGEVPGILREAGEAARRKGSATVRVRSGDFRPGVDVVPGNLVRLAERRASLRR